MEYIYNNDTLLHSIGFNFQRLESILKHGIVSLTKAKELAINYAKNYTLDGQDDNYISSVLYKNIDFSSNNSAYKIYIKKGII